MAALHVCDEELTFDKSGDLMTRLCGHSTTTLYMIFSVRLYLVLLPPYPAQH